MSLRRDVISVPMWADIAGLGDDGRCIATARQLIADGEGPRVVDVRRRNGRGVPGIRLRDHRRWVRANPWAQYLAAEAARNAVKPNNRS